MFMSEDIFTPGGYTRIKFLDQLIRKLCAGKSPLRILEIGCGNGNFLHYLDREIDNIESIAGADLNDEMIRKAAEEPFRHPAVFKCGDVFEKFGGDKKFDAVFLFDVLEHIEDDSGFVQKIKDSLLNSGGYIVIGVPAQMYLWSHVDELMGHYRRYSKERLREIMLINQFSEYSVFSIGFLTGFLTPYIFKHLKRTKKQTASKTDLTRASAENYIPGWYKKYYFALKLLLPLFYLFDLIIKHTPAGNQYLLIARKS